VKACIDACIRSVLPRPPYCRADGTARPRHEPARWCDPVCLPVCAQALAINQKYLVPASLGYILCCNNLAAVHDKLGDRAHALGYYEKARQVGQAPPQKPARAVEKDRPYCGGRGMILISRLALVLRSLLPPRIGPALSGVPVCHPPCRSLDSK
jgi:hypothetical protein